MNDKTLRILSPDVGGLTGKRREAFFKQMLISFAILLFMVPFIIIGEATNSSDTPVLIIGISLYCGQFIYATLKGEMLWQLKRQERKLIARDRRSNEQELMMYAQNLQNKKGGNHGS